MSRLKNETIYNDDEGVELKVIDLVETLVHNGIDLRIEFCQCSWFLKNEKGQAIGRRRPVARLQLARLQLSRESALDLARRITDLLERSSRNVTEQSASSKRLMN
jgi:hypothetical protein